VGLGWFAREWALPGIARSAFTEATVVTDVDADAVEAVAAEHDVTGVTPAEFRAGAVVDEYDAVYVATPNATHLSTWRPPPSRGRRSYARSLWRRRWTAPGDSSRRVETPECH